MSCGCLSECGKTVPPGTQVPPESVLDVMTASEIVAGWDAAETTRIAGAVSEFFDLSGNGFSLTQGTAGARPTFNAAGGPNGNPSALFDGVDDFVQNAALNLPAPGATPVYYWGVLRQVTWINGDRFWDAGGGGSLTFVQQIGGVDTVFAFNGAGGPLSAALTLNTYRIVAINFTNSIADYLDISGNRVTGIDTGNNDPGALFVVGSANGLVLFANFELCELWIFNVTPTALQFARLRSYAVGRYGPSVVA